MPMSKLQLLPHPPRQRHGTKHQPFFGRSNSATSINTACARLATFTADQLSDIASRLSPVSCTTKTTRRTCDPPSLNRTHPDKQQGQARAYDGRRRRNIWYLRWRRLFHLPFFPVTTIGTQETTAAGEEFVCAAYVESEGRGWRWREYPSTKEDQGGRRAGGCWWGWRPLSWLWESCMLSFCFPFLYYLSLFMCPAVRGWSCISCLYGDWCE